MEKYPFPVVNGMVAVEHVNYLLDGRAKLIDALKKVTYGGITTKDIRELLLEMGELKDGE